MIGGKALEFGVHNPPEGKDFETMKRLCQTAEKLGYDLFTMTDHFMNMSNPAGRENHPLECWTTLAGLAAVTDKISLGPLVSCANYRHPTVLAKIATTVDIISGGRLLFGIGAGWHEMEFAGFIGRFPPPRERLGGLQDTVRICRSMFTNEFTTLTGKMYSANKTLNSPPPVQKSIPIMVGGMGEKRTLKIAAKYADISHMNPSSPQELEHKLAVLRRHCDSVKRKFSNIRIGIGLRAILDSTPKEIKSRSEDLAARKHISLDEAEKSLLTTTGPRNILNTIEKYRDLGVTLFTVNSLGLEEMKSFKDQVISKLS